MEEEIKNVEETNENKAIATLEMVNSAEKIYHEKLEEFQNHEFLIEYDLGTVNEILRFLETSAKWKFRQAFGLKKLHSKIHEQFENDLIEENGGLYLNNLHMEALGFFLESTEDSGMQFVDTYISIFEPFEKSIQNVIARKKEVDALRDDYYLLLQSYEQKLPIGVTPEDDNGN